MRLRMSLLLVLLVLICFFMSGCSILEFNGKAQLVPPQATGDEEGVRKALDEYISSESESFLSTQYKLRYPRSGNYKTAYILDDVDNEKNEEAFVFYSMVNKSETIHVNYLRKIDSTWQSISDYSYDSTAIREVDFADINGDGTKEMVIGWEIGTTREDVLCVYSLNKISMNEIANLNYTDLVLDNISTSTKKDLLVIDINSSKLDVSAKLLTVLDGSILELGSVNLDGYINSIDNVVVCSYGDAAKGIFFDGYKEGNDIVTELICWDGEELTAPFYDDVSNITSLTARVSGIQSLDVDGDGIPEWPRSEKMHGNSLMNENDDTAWLTEWCSWDFETSSVISKFYSITVPEDRYYFRIEEDWLTVLTSFYNCDNHYLFLCSYDDNDEPMNEIVLYPRDFIKDNSNNEENSTIDVNKFTEIYIRKNDKSIMAQFFKDSYLGIDENEILYRLSFY